MSLPHFRRELAIWAKSPRAAAQDGYHPLLCHLLDVAAVTQALWRSALSPATRRDVGRRGGLGEDTTGRWLAFLAGLHDIGKAAPAFQYLLDKPPTAPSERATATRARLQQAGLGGRLPPAPFPHGAISTAVLPDLLAETGLMEKAAAKLVATAVGGHHGVFPHLRANQPPTPDDLGDHAWAAARRTLVAALASVLQVQPPPPAIDLPLAMWLAGLVSVADWIGSNEAFFSYAATTTVVPPTLSPTDYWHAAQARADAALRHLGWTGGESVTPRSFTALFPSIATPRPLQQAVVELAPRLGSPSLVIIESPMGEGKTEAALYLADWAAARHGQLGCYVALPTRATSDQMFHRINDFLRCRFADAAAPAELQLLHGQALLSGEFVALRAASDQIYQLSGIEADDAGAPTLPSVVAGEWFTNRKHALLAPFGVGTIDQVLLAVLQVRHGFVRLFGLANKTVIIDEAHAYDTYMTTLLQRLLAWLGALGTSVVVLSATLPGERCRQLLAAYAEGAGATLQEVALAPYPRITWWSTAAIGSANIATSPTSIKTVRLDWVDSQLPAAEDESFPLGDALADLLADGRGCVAVICNTVDRAQRMYLGLKRVFSRHVSTNAPKLDLLHARFPFDERQAREQRILTQFGPGQDGQRAAAVLVSTQIIEQSLDLDFDLIVSDIAPIDFLLQRSGRLHRHDRSARPDRLQAPALWVGCPNTTPDDVPRFDPGTAAVYDAHILLRTWLALCDRETIAIPADVEALIAAVYGNDEPPADLTLALRETWLATRDKLRENQAADEREAKDRWIKAPGSGSPLWRMTEKSLADDAPDVHQAFQALTRLTDGPSVEVVCLYGDPGRPTIDAAGRDVVNPAHTPSLTEAKRLLGRSVRIAHKGLAGELLEREPPSGWQRSPLLRRYRLLAFDRNGTASVGKWVLHLESELGIVITRAAKGGDA